MTYELLDGTKIDLGKLAPDERDYVAELRASCERDDADYFETLKKVKGADAIPTRVGRGALTREVLESVVYRVAVDVVNRLGIREGWILAPGVTEKPKGRREELMSVTEAADELGITRAAVHDALSEGRLAGQKIGNAWVVSRADVKAYAKRTGRKGA